MQNISLIVAMNRLRIIGYQQQIPWHLPADLQYFKRITLDKNIVMGRRTFESIGRPLPGRVNWVLSRQSDYSCPGVQVISDASELPVDQELMIIGGSALYQYFLPKAQTLYITEVDCQCEGDTFFPEFDPSLWQETSSEFHPADEKNNHDYSFVCYQRIGSSCSV